MNRVIKEGALILLSFGLLFLLFHQLDWMSIFRVQKINQQTEEKLGELMIKVIKNEGQALESEEVVSVVDTISKKLCEANNIDRNSISIHVIDHPEVNAFALPNHHIVIYSALLEEAENPEELAGIMAHELAHLELNHVMKKLIKEIGMAALVGMVSGETGGQAMGELLNVVSSSAFDRTFEEDADLLAVRYLQIASINPESLANFFQKLAYSENEFSHYLEWLSTHPASANRAMLIIEEIKKIKYPEYESPLSDESWEKMKEHLKHVDE